MQLSSQKAQPSEKSFNKFIQICVEETQDTKPKSKNYDIVQNSDQYLQILEKAFTHLSSIPDKKKLASSGVEWFLDNYYVIQETVELIKDDLPQDYFNKLPSNEKNKYIPRIYHLSRKIASFNAVELVENDLNEFLEAYQRQISLKMSELWAFPLMLRLVLLEILAATIDQLIEGETQEKRPDNVDVSELDPDEVVARSLRTLLLFNNIDWKAFFENHAQVERILQNDPSNVYSRMDFDTRDRYRKVVELLAEKSSKSEADVANHAINLAKNADKSENKRNHVGYYLIDKGEATLRSQIKYQPDFSDKFQKFFFDHNIIFYLGGISLITIAVTLGLILISRFFLANTWQLVIIGILSLIPASSVAVNLVNSILTATLQPRILPKLDFSKKIPKKFKTMVAIPALMDTSDDVNHLLNQIELHYLGNKDRNIGFILLLDYADAPQETMPDDEKLKEQAIEGINELNEQYQGDDGRRPFYLYQRCRQWNPKEGVWMGWERKRGKLADFNRYLMEGFEACIETVVGDLDFLKGVRYVITLDADTIMPRDSGKALIATLAHPLNMAEFKKGTSEVISGYTILQPRTEVKPTSVNRTFFTRFFAGDLGLDLYTRAVSDVYQDLFEEGIFVGKGIYDVKAFQRSIENKVPQNALLSHDLFEGLQGRAGLVSDIVLFEEYPPDYASQVQRLHRWVRGDWQLLPWLFPRVPKYGGKSESNPFSTIDLWKILDNLRRSLLSPTTLLLMIVSWFLFDQRAWLWTLLVLLISAFPLFYNIVMSFSSRFLLGAKSNVIKSIMTAFFRWFFWIVFLPYDALIMTDAIFTTLIRLYISNKRLLQWQTSAHTISLFGKQRRITTIWQRMMGAPLLSLIIGITLFLFDQNAFWTNASLLILWVLSPQIAFWLSKEQKSNKIGDLSSSDLLKLRLIARRTWLYFERFIGPDDHWLPPDHFQEDPKGMVAHRTSPTNIGLLLLSTSTAHDFGYIGVLDFIYRVSYTFETLDELEKYRGHLLNWYDTERLSTLSPRYVSTVDSGNFAMSLIGLYQSLNQLGKDSICPDRLFQGISDSLEVFCEIIVSIENNNLKDYIQPLLDHCSTIQKEIKAKELTDSRQSDLLLDFIERLSEPMDTLIEEILKIQQLIDPAVLKVIRYWSDAIFQEITNTQRQIVHLAPWIVLWLNRPEIFDEIDNDRLKNIFSRWYEDKTLCTNLAEVPQLCERTTENIQNFLKSDFGDMQPSLAKDKSVDLKQWLLDFIEALKQSSINTIELMDQIENLKKNIDFYIERMEFGFLFDKQREVFYLGYKVGSGRLDKNHYDLLASEARTASLFAIAQNEVPRSHWLHMSRPFTGVNGIPTLLSWNGSMFEYLMPNLFTETYPETLLHQTSKGVVRAQINYGQQNNVPWGISESSYYHFDQADNYQYKGFGVPGLGRKRGLADDLVIAPYASIMAVAVDPHAVLENIQALEHEGALGHFGFYESIDYTKKRLPIGRNKAVIKSYMAHHQGMLFVALGNFLNMKTVVERVHEDPRIKSTELLLQEQIPEVETIQKTKEGKVVAAAREETKGMTLAPWMINIDKPGNAVHVLSNGSMQSLITATGSGYLSLENIALTRWREDSNLDPWGIWFYIQDLDSDKSWSIGRKPINRDSQEYRVLFAPHLVEIRHLVDDIRTVMQITISPNDDVCIHKIEINNQSPEERHLRILSYGEVVLAPQASDQQHPAFNKLFIESAYDKGHKLLHFQRRKRSADEDPYGMAHCIYDNYPGDVAFESNRNNFIGRGRDIHNPIVLENGKSLTGCIGVTLDPIFSIAKEVELAPNQPATISYITIAAENINQSRTIAEKYQDSLRIETIFSSAESHNEKLVRALELETSQLSKYQALLSHIIHPIPELRAKPSLLEKNVLGQSGLWPFGISGDYPILLIKIAHKEQIQSLQEVLLAHTYWQRIGLMIDFVIMNTKDTGYAHELNDKIHQAINVMDRQSWVNRRGGIFVLTANQIEKANSTLIETAANVVINLSAGDLDAHLDKTDSIQPPLPNFIPTDPEKKFLTNETFQRPDDLLFFNGVGGFTADGREYQIFMHKYPNLLQNSGQITPNPWTNVIANEDFGFLITESGGGYTWSMNSGENRLTPWTNDPVSDPSGESLYLRDEMSGKIWTPTPQPAGIGEDYLVRHGQGYTIFESKNNGFKQQLRVYADPIEPVKIMTLTLANISNQNRRVTSTYFAEWVLGTNRGTSKKFILPDYDDETGSLLAKNPYTPDFPDRVAFLTSDQDVHGLTTDRREFLGSPGSRHKPAALQRVGLSGRISPGLDPCAALQIHLNFEPKEKKTITFILGQGKNLNEAKALAKSFSQGIKIQESWQKIQTIWDDRLGIVTVNTPEKQLDLILNRWLPYQTLSCRIWGRSAFYQSSGAYGFRDQLQDVSAIMMMMPEKTRDHILRSARHQFDTGDVLHWWHPPSGRGVRTRITDDLLWLVYVTAEYIRQTGDNDILDEKVPFLIGEPLNEDEQEHYGHFESSEESYSLFEHCRRALERGDTQGKHNLPLMGGGDWNDGMNRVGIEGKGESVWLAWFIYENHKRFAELCNLIGEADLAQQHQDRAELLKNNINDNAWDGAWFVRAFYDDGTPLGSAMNEECQIDSLPQSWSVLTDGASQERKERAMRSVADHLVNQEDRFIQLFTPPFNKTSKDPGYIKGYPPGIRENGGQYTHAATWVVWAQTEMGQGNRAFEQFQLLNPITHSLDLENVNRYKVEPYVVAADIYSQPPHVGHGGWTWYTGSSGWLYRLGIEAILGLRLSADHFMVNPCIPNTWEEYHVTFKHNGCVYSIIVENPDRIEKGVIEVTLDGILIKNKKIPYQDDHKEHKVKITMGE